MEEQIDFLKKLDIDQSVNATEELSPKQIELNGLLIKKEELSGQIDRCPMCSGGEGYRCNSGHSQDWAILQERIKLLEDSMAV
jgi:hypothetical protein